MTGKKTDRMELERVLGHVRQAIRDEKPYLVETLAAPEAKLNQNESPFDLPPSLKRELVERLMEIPFNRYPGEQPWALCRALARFTGHDAGGILVGNGSNELTHTLGLALVEKGTAVVLPRPMFALYESMVRMHEGRVIAVPPRDDLSFDAEALREAVLREDPALTVLTTPNNPTGLAMPLEAVERIVAAAHGFVVVDEAYVEFTDEESPSLLLDDHPNLIILRTLSKAFGLAGLRVGYLMAQPEVAAALLKARLPFMVDRFAEAVALAVLERPTLLEERAAAIKASCAALHEALDEIDDVDVLPSQANFLLFRTPVEPSQLIDRLGEHRVMVRSMAGYPELKGFVRVNAGTPAENRVFLVALKQALSERLP